MEHPTLGCIKSVRKDNIWLTLYNSGKKTWSNEDKSKIFCLFSRIYNSVQFNEHSYETRIKKYDKSFDCKFCTYADNYISKSRTYHSNQI